MAKFTKHEAICIELGVPFDTPVSDAKKDLDITVEAIDIRRAKTRDPQNCGYANAICRQTGAPKAAVRRYATYVLTERYGKPHILRYITHEDARIILSRFDRTGKMVTHEMTLKAPPPSQQLEVKREHMRRYHKAVAAGEREVTPTGPQVRPKIKNLRPRLGTAVPA